MALQLALYVASGAIVVLAAVLVRVLLRFNLQLDRVVTAVLDLEAELTPLARETRVVIDRLGDLSERAVGIADSPLLAPVLAGNRAAQFIRTGATTFLRALWTGRPQSHPKAKAS
jgi:hypothetical protein